MTAIRPFTFSPDDGVPPAVAPFVHATAAGQTLYVTGQTPTGVDGLVVGAGVVSVRAFLMHWDDYGAFNVAYAQWFPDRLPSRTCVGVSGLAVGALVEIDWVCWRDDGWG